MNARAAFGSTLPLAATALLGAFLLFLVQPLIGKTILPWFGGASAVWTACMLFFQAALVAGYTGVFLLAKLPKTERRSDLFLLGLAVSLCFLPIVPNAAWKPAPEDLPTLRVVALLAVTLGVPYVMLAMTAPLVQAWYVRIHEGRTPYRLYALSNVGSLLGLLAYPLVVEPNLDVVTQACWWSVGYAVFAVLAAWCAWRVGKLPDPPIEVVAAPKTKRNKPEPVEMVSPARQVFAWLGLSAAGVVLLLVVTNYLCQDVTAVPFLWVAPLAVYLVTFILSFDRPQWYHRLPYAAAVGVWVPWILTTRGVSFDTAATQQLGLLFAGGMICHGELARRKPPPQDLARYYLLIACGGALGGGFVSLLAPVIFQRDWERAWALAGLASFTIICAMPLVARFADMSRRTQIGVTVMTILAITASVLLEFQRQFRAREVAVARNFYGIVSVHGPEDPDRPGHYRHLSMMSGSTLHGTEVFVPGERPVAESYYGPTTGVGRTILDLQREPQPRRIGIVGLGAGTLAAYGRPGDVYRFYELNPAVADFAQRYFTYLRESQAKCDVVLGDGRLSLEAESPQQFDLLVLDAFTSDAIPTHLLTLEAFAVWLRHIKDDGRIALHVSNRHVNLVPVVAAAAEHYGLTGILIDNPGEAIAASQAAKWVVLARKSELAALPSTPKSTVTPLSGLTKPLRPWTDSFSSLLGILQ